MSPEFKLHPEFTLYPEFELHAEFKLYSFITSESLRYTVKPKTSST